jgi:hypothetical protein
LAEEIEEALGKDGHTMENSSIGTEISLTVAGEISDITIKSGRCNNGSMQ